MKHVLMGLTALGMAFTANAAEREQVSSEFSYSKQQLQTKEGASQILERLAETALEACQIEHPYHQRYSVGTDDTCYDEVLADAVAKIDSATLTQVYLEQDG